ncbi:SDR family oxidoreductase [Chitinophaga defluvii]|uniref:SDR family oxidoreductase n=1 Tax=Chitinophaga defluvii TaxID=3163343 RepID=A0ABV2T235_9BACT
MMDNNSKIALITGGSRGLGKNTALQLARNGHQVVLTYHTRQEEAQKVVNEIEQLGQQAFALQLDTANISSFPAFIEALSTELSSRWHTSQVDFLINNAGIDASSRIPDTTETAFDQLFNVHFKGVYFLTQKMLPLLADGGRIVNFSTGLARFVIPGYAAYASMKGAIENFTRYLAKELGNRNITANVVAPGPIETDFTRHAFETNTQMKGYLASQTALGRVGTPDDIGGVVAFLCSEQARWVTAQRIEASGGTFL